MSLKEALTQYDGFGPISRGMDSGREPSLIGIDQHAFLINATTRPGYTANRPGWFKHELEGDDFQLGRWQMAGTYIAANGHPYLIASIGGNIVRFDPLLDQVTDLSAASGLTNPSNLPRAWFTQAEIYFLIQDNSSIPLIFDGATMRRANTVAFGGNEFPIGNVMEYNNGRLWVALPDRRSFVGGDLAYSVTGTAADVLTQTQNQFLSSGGVFALPSNAGFITAMRNVAVQDSVLGQGPLIVFGQFASAAINAPFDSAVWQQTNSPIQTISILSPGPTSQESCIPVNGDLWYRAQDGVRSYMVARRDHNTWVNTPLSHEMERVLNRDDSNLLGFVSAVDFDNRRLETVSPFRATFDGIEYGTAFRGLSVLDFKPVSSMFDRTQPCWDGIWNGLSILQVLCVNVYGKDRCYMFALNQCAQIEFWELSRDNQFDNMMDRIEWAVETRSLGFPDKAELLKQLQRTETWLEAIAGDLDYDIKYRPDLYLGWLDLDSGSFCASIGMCNPPGCTTPQGPLPQYRPRRISSGPNEDCEGCVQKRYATGFEYQFRLTLTGPGRLRRFRAVAVEVPEDDTGGCLGAEDSGEDCCEETSCEPNPWAYETANTCEEPDDGPAFPPERPGGCQAPPNIASFEASDTEIEAGDPITLSWGEVTNASSCEIDQGIGAIAASPDSLLIDPGPAVTTTYTMTAICGEDTVTRFVTVFVDETPPVVPPIEYVPDDGLPTMPCGTPIEWDWEEAGFHVRYPSSTIHGSDPNSTITDAALLTWWAEQANAAFLASGTPYSSYKLFWNWSTEMNSWNVTQLYLTGSHVGYFTPGWIISVAYCP